MTPPSLTASAQRRITAMASMTSVHHAFRWLHLHQPQVREWLLELVRIPAPPFGERQRAEWFLRTFESLGLSNVHLDAIGNAVAEISPAPSARDKRVLLVSAHLDTVFPSGTACEPAQEANSSRILGPGVCDNAAGLSALLALAASMRSAEICPAVPILFVANVGEEGEGDLRGMRHLFDESPYADRIAAAIALEGGGSSAVVTRGLGSLRLKVTVTGPGGHSWTDAGIQNPIFLLSRALAELSRLALPKDPKTTLSAGLIEGGTSVNSIPESAAALLDLRSTEPAQIRSTAEEIRTILVRSILRSNEENPTQQAAKLSVSVIGDRPPGALRDDAPILDTIRAVDRHLSIRSEARIGSTDANIPLSRGIPAIALGGGGSGGGIHTLGEWYDPAGREIALRRILLTLLDTAQQIAQSESD